MTRYLKLAPKNTSEYQISAKSVKEVGSYEYVKLRPTRPLKHRLWKHVYRITQPPVLTCLQLREASRRIHRGRKYVFVFR